MLLPMSVLASLLQPLLPCGSVVKTPPAMQETQEMWVWSLGREDSPEDDVTMHFSILAWRIPWREEPGGLQSIESQRVGHNWRDWAHAHWDLSLVGLPISLLFSDAHLLLPWSLLLTRKMLAIPLTPGPSYPVVPQADPAQGTRQADPPVGSDPMVSGTWRC